MDIQSNTPKAVILKNTAHRNSKIGGYDYKGFYLDKPVGTQYWNVYKCDESGMPDFCFAECHCESFKECKITIDNILQK